MYEQKPKLFIDLDSTLNTLEHEWVQAYNKDYNDNLTRDDMVRWEIHTYVKPECGKNIYKYLNYDMFRNLGVKPHSQEVTKELQEKYDLYILTAFHVDQEGRNLPNLAEVFKAKLEWIEEHFPHIGANRAIFATDKSTVHGFLIDDGGHNIETFNGHSLLLDMPYNRYLGNMGYNKTGHVFERVYDWTQIGRKLGQRGQVVI